MILAIPLRFARGNDDDDDDDDVDAAAAGDSATADVEEGAMWEDLLLESPLLSEWPLLSPC